MSEEKIEYNCPLEYIQKLIGGKWKPIILSYLASKGILRYGVLKRSIPTISDKMLSEQLKELEADGLIHRKQYKQVPPKVEYSITDKGETVVPLLKKMNQWGLENMEE